MLIGRSAAITPAMPVQKGVRPAVGIFLGMSAMAALLSTLLPIETKGRELAEDAAELELQHLEEKPSDASTNGKQTAAGSNYSSSITLMPGSLASNPFHTEDIEASQAIDESHGRMQPRKQGLVAWRTE
jgi:hypothetical protein